MLSQKFLNWKHAQQKVNHCSVREEKEKRKRKNYKNQKALKFLVQKILKILISVKKHYPSGKACCRDANTSLSS